MEKHIAVVSGDQIYDVVIRPGTSANEIVNQLRLPDEFILSKRDGLPLGDTEPVFGLVRDGEKLFASAPAEVGLPK